MKPIIFKAISYTNLPGKRWVSIANGQTTFHRSLEKACNNVLNSRKSKKPLSYKQRVRTATVLAEESRVREYLERR